MFHLLFGMNGLQIIWHIYRPNIKVCVNWRSIHYVIGLRNWLVGLQIEALEEFWQNHPLHIWNVQLQNMLLRHEKCRIESVRISSSLRLMRSDLNHFYITRFNRRQDETNMISSCTHNLSNYRTNVPIKARTSVNASSVYHNYLFLGNKFRLRSMAAALKVWITFTTGTLVAGSPTWLRAAIEIYLASSAL